MRKDWGRLVLVVGPSGAGKDSIIRGAQTEFENDSSFVFPRRVVTRKADVVAEDHDTVSEMDFALNVANGNYAVWWSAHGNSYGIPIGIDDDLRVGRTVVFNCSRAVIGDLQKQYLNVAIADVQVSTSQLVARIVARGRESREQAMIRVAREVPAFPPGTNVFPIRNDGALSVAISSFCNLLRMLNHAGSDPGRRPLDDQDQDEDGNDGRGRLVVVKHF